MLASRAARALSPARLAQIVAATAAQPGRWSDVLRFDAGRRWYHRLQLADDHEVWLLTWLPGQSTGFHDHGIAVGAFAVARGRVSERTMAAGGHQVRHRTVPAGASRSFGSRHVPHGVNAFREPTVSRQSHSPPLPAIPVHG